MQDPAKEYCLNTIKESLTPQVFTILTALFEVGKNNVPSSQQSPWRTFQESLRDIPDWNMKLIKEQTGRALTACPQLEKLVATAVMCQSIQLAAARNIELEARDVSPIKPEQFVHDLYVKTAQELVHNPMLFGQSAPELAVQNREKVTNIINQCTDLVVNSYVPVALIMSKHMKRSSHTKPKANAFPQTPSSSPYNYARSSARRGNTSSKHSLGAYDSDTFDSGQEPSFLLTDNDLGASAMDDSHQATDLNDEPLIVEIQPEPQPESTTVNPSVTATVTPTLEHSFMYAPSMVGGKLNYKDAKALLSNVIA